MHAQVRRVLGRDRHMRRLMKALGPAPVGQRDLFDALTRAVVSQMLSADAARAIMGRLQHRVGLEPARLARVQRRTLWKLGLSKAKADCVRTVARRFVAGDLETLPRCSDEEVYERLTAIKGIGRWTAEMVMIFSLGRPDVWPVADAGIQRAVAKLYGVEREGLETFGDRFRPVRSYACWYLWRSLDG
jgi:DNA-3-methyladenine glycosylase II